MAYSNSYIGDTGQGAVIVIVDNSDTSIEPCMGCPRSIQLPELTMEAIDTTCLDDTGFMRRIPATFLIQVLLKQHSFMMQLRLDLPSCLLMVSSCW